MVVQQSFSSFQHDGMYINYYYIGIFYNENHKYNYLKFRSKIEVLKEKSNAMQSDLFRLLQEKERNCGKRNLIILKVVNM